MALNLDDSAGGCHPKAAEAPDFASSPTLQTHNILDYPNPSSVDAANCRLLRQIERHRAEDHHADATAWSVRVGAMGLYIYIYMHIFYIFSPSF